MRERAALCAAMALVSGLLGCGPRPFTQRDRARILAPAVVRATPGAPEAVPLRVLRVRAYADASYRGGTAQWAEQIAEQVGRASLVIEEEFGVRLALESVRPWDRPAGDDLLERVLGELLDHDEGADVDWVVGFVGARVEDAKSWHDSAGRARLFGRHFVLRAMETHTDVARLETWDELSATEREAMRRGWRLHKETTTFLHEWAHTLGAVHECEGKWIMSPKYSLLTEAFSPASARFVRLGLERRDGKGSAGAREWASAWRSEARHLQGASWECKVLEDALAEGERFLVGAVRLGGLDRFDRSWRYSRLISKPIEARWKTVVLSRPGAEVEGTSAVEIRIDGAGTVKAVRITATSGTAALDDAALETIRSSEPFPPPPPGLLDANGEFVFRIRLTWKL